MVDVLGARLFEAIRRRSARRLFIDGLEGFEATSDEPARVRAVLAILARLLEQEDVTTVFTLETRALSVRTELPKSCR